jgi:4-amino-4-deoxy-L-arabinose transferase-like glycosyltransferase
MIKSKLLSYFLLIVIMFTMLNIYYISKVDYVGGGDDPRYAMIAQNLLAGRGYVVDVINKFFYPYPREVTHPDDVYPPVYPFAVAGLFAAFGDNVLFTKLPSLLFALLIIPILTFLIGKEIFSEKVGFVAGLLAMLNPSSFAWSGIADSMFAGWCLAALYCLIRGMKDARWLYGVGILLAISYLTKPTGLIVTLVILGAYVLTVAYQKKWPAKQLIIGCVLGLLLVTPWLVRNERAFGSPTFSIYSDYIYFEGFLGEEKNEVSTKLYWDTDINLHWFLERFSIKDIVLKVFHELVRTFLYLGIILFVGFLGAFSAKRKDVLFIIGALVVAFVVFYSVIYMFNIRYYLPVVPLLLIFAVAWFIDGKIWTKTHERRTLVKWACAGALILLVVFSVSRFYVSYSYLPLGIHAEPGYPRSANEPAIQYRLETINWLKNNVPAGTAMLVAFRPHDIVYYTGIKTVSVPFEDMEIVLEVADYFRAEYIHVTKKVTERNRIEAIEHLDTDPRFTLVYENENEQVYRIEWSRIVLEKSLVPGSQAR